MCPSRTAYHGISFRRAIPCYYYSARPHEMPVRRQLPSIIIIRLHRLHAVHGCGLLLAYNVSQRRQKWTEPRTQATCTKKLVKFGRMVFWDDIEVDDNNNDNDISLLLLLSLVGSRVLRWAYLSLCFSVCVCVSVRSHISKTTCPNFTTFSVHVACVRGWVHFWRHCDTLCI